MPPANAKPVAPAPVKAAEFPLIVLFVIVFVAPAPPPMKTPAPNTEEAEAAIALFDVLFEIVVFVMLTVATLFI